MKKIVILIGVIFLFQTLGAGALSNEYNKTVIYKENAKIQCELLENNGSEYWALLVACEEFLNKDAPLPYNNRTVEDLEKLLLCSDHWQQDHIRVLTGKNATWRNIFKGLQWLDDMDDEDDICLFYISTHGYQADDIFPKDEADNQDEFLLVYDSDRLYFPRLNLKIHIPLRLFYIYDDDLNYMFNKLDAKGFCAIFNTCHSGGFDDQSSDYNERMAKKTLQSDDSMISSKKWMEEFAHDLSAPGRVILMSSQEDIHTRSYQFVYFLLEALQGFGNTDDDATVSAEEAFDYAVLKTSNFLQKEYDFPQIPQIYDNFAGELPLTTCEFPPDHPSFEGANTGETNTEYTFTISSKDPEDDMIKYYVDWGDGTEEWTDFHPSGDYIELYHTWEKEGTYNIWFENRDEFEIDRYEPSFLNKKVITIDNKNSVDQYQTVTYESQCFNDVIITDRIWFAQSFIPTQPLISMVDLEGMFKDYLSEEEGPLLLSLRSNLSGEDLIEASALPKNHISDYLNPAFIRDFFNQRRTWLRFDFPDIQVTPGKIYYLICRFESKSTGVWTYSGINYNDDLGYIEDSYPDGNVFISTNKGRTWSEYPIISDLCFVTYGS